MLYNNDRPKFKLPATLNPMRFLQQTKNQLHPYYLSNVYLYQLLFESRFHIKQRDELIGVSPENRRISFMPVLFFTAIIMLKLKYKWCDDYYRYQYIVSAFLHPRRSLAVSCCCFFAFRRPKRTWLGRIPSWHTPWLSADDFDRDALYKRV